MKLNSYWAWISAHLILLVALAYYSFSRNIGNLAFGGDGGQEIISVMHQWIWSPAALGFYSNPFQGLNDIWFNINTKLIPGYLLPLLFEKDGGAVGTQYIVLCYVVFSIELFLSTIVLARALGMNWFISLVSAWTLPLLGQPFFGYSLLFPFMMNSPSTGTMLAEFSLLLAAIIYLGRGEGELKAALWRNLLPGFMVLILLIALVASQPLRVILWLPVLAVVVLGSILGATGRERALKFFILAFIAVLLLSSGVGFFVYGMFSFTVANFWTGKLENVLTQPEFVSIWYGNAGIGPMGPKLFGFGVFGMLVALVFGDRRMRFIAISLLVSIGFILVLGYAALEWKFWRGPGPIYFEFLIWPLYAIFGVFGLAYIPVRLFELLPKLSMRLAGWGRSRLASGLVNLFLLVAIPGFAFAHPWSVSNPKRMFPIPPSKPPMIALLEQRLGLTPGGPFRGRVVTMELINKPGTVGWMDIVNQDWPRYAATGNEYHWNGLWYFGVPTLFEYSASMSPAYFRAITRMLALPIDTQIRNIVVLRRANAQALGILGVRFVISDTKLPDPFQLVMTEATHLDEVLFLYEVPDVNSGTFSPTAVKIVNGFDEAVDRMTETGFDAKRSVVAFDPALASEHLVPADNTEFLMVPGGISIKAKSAGMSLLVLPFEFSRCLRIRVDGNAANPPRLFRVNALETGVLFDKQVTANIEYFTGLFQNAGCRGGDVRDLSRILAQPPEPKISGNGH